MNEVDSRIYQRAITRFWGLMLVQSFVAIGLGLYAVLNPGQTAATVVQIIAIFIVVSGIFAVIEGFMQRRTVRLWSGRFYNGVIMILLGLLVFGAANFIAELTLTILIYLVGIAAFLGGASSILRALRTKRWHLLVTGSLWIILALVLFTQTDATAAVLVWIAGVFFLLFGLLLFYLAFRLRKVGKTITTTTSGEVIEGQVIEGEIVEE